ncbi:type III secretion system inner membrane ring lipoprotein SctJ [Pseudaquabacterium terrae]|nr:type III secretion inner membrane ring lipoprotein SctJ [Aquabacterium terrae]
MHALLALTLALLLSGCTVELYSGLSEQEANEMLAALSAEGIDARKQRGEGSQWAVQVDEARLGAAVAVLRNNGLPQERYTTLGEVFQRQGLVSTPAEERMRYIHAVSQELSQTLRKLDGVVVARVHVVIPANDPLSDKLKPSSASVFIKHRPDTDLRLLVPAVKDMVAHGIEGLAHEQVSLTLVEARRLAVPDRAVPEAQGPAVAGLAEWLPGRTAAVLAGLFAAAALALAALPALLRRRGRDWRWFARQVFRR